MRHIELDDTARWRRRAERERQAREEAEGIAERATRALYLSNEKLADANEVLAQNSQALYRELFARNPLPLIVADGHTLGVLEVNDAALKLYGFTTEEFITLTLADIQLGGLEVIRDSARAEGHGETLLCTHRTKDSRLLDIDLSVHKVSWEKRSAILLVAQDITRQTRDRRALELRTQAIEASRNGIFICAGDAAAEWPVVYLNGAMEQLLDLDRARCRDRPLSALFGAAFDPDRMRNVVAGSPLRDEIQLNPNVPGQRWLEIQITPVPDDDGAVAHCIGTVLDISDRKAFEAELLRRAQHDILTGLPNRDLLEQRMRTEIKQAAASGEQLALLFIDFDNFKQINDLGGHAAGDAYLKTLAVRLSERLSTHEILARVGGDEFVMLARASNVRQAVPRLIARFRAAFAEPVNVGLHTFQTRCSIGAALYPEHGEDAETLLRRADIAMYNAKHRGGGAFAAFAPQMETRFRQRSEIEQLLQQALTDQAFEVHYQPQIEIATGRIIGVEALLRWPDAPVEYAGPAKFIPVAEDSGLIKPIGEFVLDRACSDMADLHAHGHAELSLAVNLSAVHLADSGVVELIRRTLERYGLAARALELEVTESAVMQDPEYSQNTLQSLKELGVTIAIDDFGTGYSSLAYLHQLPVHRLKIDRSFIADMAYSAKADALVRAIFDLGCHLEFTPIAEGIETEEDRARLISYGCAIGQGYYFSRPVPLSALSKLLSAGPIKPWLAEYATM